MTLARPLIVAALFALSAAACADDPAAPVAEVPYETLSEYGLFVGALADQVPADHVHPYRPVSPLWADHADKGRFIALPPGATIDPVGEEEWVFPLGTILVKSFLLSEDRSDPDATPRIIETRLLIRDDSDEGWSAHTYVWNDAQTEATRLVAGARITLDTRSEDGTAEEQVYLVPNTNQCRDCHGRDDVTVPLGVTRYQLDFALDDGTNQLRALADAGVFAAVPASSDHPLAAPGDETLPLADRARAYLHANCSHCHRPGGDGGRTGLDLRAWQDEPADFGICKTPVAAGAGTGGRSYDIVPGDADASILPFRMESTDPEIRMPELPSRIADDFGVTLVRAWIDAMPSAPCDSP